MKRGKEGLYVHQNSVSRKGEEGGEQLEAKESERVNSNERVGGWSKK